MKKNVLFITDFLRNDINGGAEANDDVLIKELRKEYNVKTIRSSDVTEQILDKFSFLIVSNFVHLSEKNKKYISLKKDYIIYEHDHKYIKNRDPSIYKDFLAPYNKKCNVTFYRSAKKVFVLSKVCKEILEKNIIGVRTHSIGCSLWSDESLDKMLVLSREQKSKDCCILKSENPTKNYKFTVQYCASKGISPDHLSDLDYYSFLEKFSKYEKFIFLPKVLETFSRVCAEAKMMNIKLVTIPNKIGFASEEIFNLSGSKLIEQIRARRDQAVKKFVECIEDSTFNQLSKIAFIGKFENIYDEEGKALALEKQGYKVLRFDEDTFGKDPYSLNNEEGLFSESPEYIIFTKLRVPNYKNILSKASQLGIKTICWVPDLYFGFRDRPKILQEEGGIFTSDFVFTPDGGNDKNFRQLGINHFCVRQGISKYYLTPPIGEDNKDLDIVFIGTCYSERRARLINFLSETYKDKFHWFGKNGANQLRGEELRQVYNRSKIIIGDCYPSDFYWSNRVYEALGRGSFLIHPDVKGLETEFEYGKDLFVFERDNFSDLANKINISLENPSLRAKVATNGYNKVKERDTLENRAKQVMDLIT